LNLEERKTSETKAFITWANPLGLDSILSLSKLVIQMSVIRTLANAKEQHFSGIQPEKVLLRITSQEHLLALVSST